MTNGGRVDPKAAGAGRPVQRPRPGRRPGVRPGARAVLIGQQGRPSRQGAGRYGAGRRPAPSTGSTAEPDRCRHQPDRVRRRRHPARPGHRAGPGRVAADGCAWSRSCCPRATTSSPRRWPGRSRSPAASRPRSRAPPRRWTRVLAELGLPAGESALADGSGLSRTNRLSPSLLTDLLAHAAGGDRPELVRRVQRPAGRRLVRHAAPTASRPRRAPARPGSGVVRAKTGTLTGVERDVRRGGHRRRPAAGLRAAGRRGAGRRTRTAQAALDRDRRRRWPPAAAADAAAGT